MNNKYNKPWKVEYDTHDWRGVPYTEPYEVSNIRDCNNTVIINTDGGVYGLNAETAEYIVKCVNEAKEG